ncbi:sugar phosphate isomerase/epimerase family protein [Sphingobacterium sp. SGR-19]|uniref:sugar phosphate isomerase/epimerase family protein n=1 Tax=Sphingobacterium sp. SGR-19 TaxID=2710886 RepID=UPI0013EC07DD|nr:sugar phosphate isomerase/epimerase family protein [Sphingobacterium sp. SGR-19]NGM64581.1 sugar phosphate isomerase/epimerase [Sphingobacterium sp. SGR-19]
MSRLVTLYSLQWGDLSLEDVCAKAKEFGYDGLELGLPDHLDVRQTDPEYYKDIQNLLGKYGLQLKAISSHLVGQAVCDRIDERHKGILPPYIWGDGEPEGVRQRAAEELILTAKAAKSLGVNTVVGFTGSPIWHLLYAFPPVPEWMIEEGYQAFARRFIPILDAFEKIGVRFALEVHPTEIAFDTVSARRALEAVGNHPAFGFNYDPSHLGYQGVDYVDFIYQFPDRIFHVHMKDVYWSDTPKQVGVFGGHVAFGDPRRYWNFRSVGRGRINFEDIIRALNVIGYQGPLSIEWEDSAMDREHGARESCEFTKRIDFQMSKHAFDAFFAKD